MSNLPPGELPPAGTPAEFVAVVHRTAVGPTPPPREPLPDTLPVETELAAGRASNTIPEAPLVVPQVRERPSVAAEPPPKRSRGWLYGLVITVLIAAGGYASYVYVDAVQSYVDGMIDAAFR